MYLALKHYLFNICYRLIDYLGVFDSSFRNFTVIDYTHKGFFLKHEMDLKWFLKVRNPRIFLGCQ